MLTDFKELFRGMEPKYISAVFQKMQPQQVSSLTELEKELCILLWMNFDNFEIAQLLNIEVADVELERERVREKLGVGDEDSIQGYMQKNLA